MEPENMENLIPLPFSNDSQRALHPLYQGWAGNGEVPEQNEQSYRQLSELLHDILFVYEASGKIRFINRAGWKILDAQGPDEVIGRNLFDFIHPEDAPEFLKRFTHVTKKGGTFSPAIHRITTLERREVYLESGGGPLVHEGETCVYVVSHDVTREKQMEKRIKKEQDALKKLIFLNPFPVFLYSDKGRYVRGNQAYLDLFGKEPPPDYCFFQDPVLIRAGFKNELMKLKSGQPCHIQEVWYNPRDVDPEAPDRPRCVSLSSFPVYSEEGRVESFVGMLRDITPQKSAEMSLRISEEKFTKAIQLSPLIMVMTRLRDGQLMDFNEAFEKFIGCDRDELVGKTSIDLGFWERPEDRERFIQALNHGELPIQAPIRTGSGEKRMVRFFGERISAGPEPCLLLVMEDITEQLEAREELQRSQESYRQIFNSVTEMISVHDPENGAILDVNRAWLDAMGYTKEEVLGKTIDSFCVENESDACQSTNSWIQRANQEGPQTAEWVARNKDGRVMWNEVTLKPASIGGRESVVAVVRDITDRKSMEAQLNKERETLENIIDMNPYAIAFYIENLTELDATRKALIESESKYRSVVENSNDGILVLQGDAIQYANSQVSAMTGVPIPYLLDQPFVECIPSEEAPCILEFVNKGSTGSATPARLEAELMHKDGTCVEVEITSNTIPFEGQSAHLVVLRDISRRKVYEKRLFQGQKMEAIGTLAGGIAHDFNNILTPILGFTEMTMNALDPKDKPYQNLEQVFTAAQRAENLVKQILAFSRQRDYEKKPFQIAPLVTEVIKLLRASLPTTIDIKLDLLKDIRPIIADPTGVHQILMNLCTNAYHAMREQGGVLSLTFEETEVGDGDQDEWGQIAPGTYLRMAVCDTGYGMEKEVLEKIFRPYFTTKAEGEGTGMGLAVVHGIVKSHEGRISVYSEPGKGTAFHVFLPMFNGLEEDEDALPAPVLSEPAMRGHEHVLVVDDEESILTMVQQSLTDLGYEVTAYTLSEDAFQAFEQQPGKFDLVITDQTMPHMTGMELAQKAMRIRPDIPVVLLTGYSEIVTRESAATLGIREFIMKPVLTSRLAKAIRRVLDANDGSQTKTAER
jgi:PAS domain S-box-containing protein